MVSTTKVVLIAFIIILTAVVMYYLIALRKKHNQEHVLYLQSNSTHPLQTSTALKTLTVYDTNTLTYDIQIGKVVLDTYLDSSTSGRFILLFSQTGTINLNVIDDAGAIVGKVETVNIQAYYPVIVEFTTNSTSKILYLQYSTSVQSISLYKLSLEFY